MNKLKAVMAHIASNYPYKADLSKARITKLVYLTDWFSSLLDEKQVTSIDWLFNHYGPYVDDVTTIANMDDDFTITPEKTVYGGDKYVISYHGESAIEGLSEREKAIIDTIIDKTKGMYFNDFINYVYSTYPISSNERYSQLDLVALAKKYKAEKRSLVPS